MKNDGTANELYVGKDYQRPLFFLGAMRKDDFWAIGGNDEDFRAPGYEDTWLGECISRKYNVVYSDVVGYHQEHARPKNLRKRVKPSEELFNQKMKDENFEAKNRPLEVKTNFRIYLVLTSTILKTTGV
jgi:hypothetical protein